MISRDEHKRYELGYYALSEARSGMAFVANARGAQRNKKDVEHQIPIVNYNRHRPARVLDLFLIAANR